MVRAQKLRSKRKHGEASKPETERTEMWVLDKTILVLRTRMHQAYYQNNIQSSDSSFEAL